MSPADDPRGPTEPLPARGGGSGSTQPMPPGQRPRSQARDRRLWIVAGVLALVLVAFAGFLVGRSQAPGKQATQAKPAAVEGPRRACARALEFADRALAIQQRALANRAALAQATAAGDTDLVGRLEEEFDLLSRRFERIEGHMRKAANRCRG